MYFVLNVSYSNFGYPQDPEYENLLKSMGNKQAMLNWTECFDINKQSKTYKNLKSEIRSIGRFIESHEMLMQSLEMKAIADKIYEDALEIKEVSIEKTYRQPNVYFNHKAVVNLTKVVIPEDIMLALSFGYKFLFPFNTNDSNIHEILAQIEQTVEQSISEASHIEAYAEIAHILRARNRFQENENLQWLNFISDRTKRFFKKHEKIFATKSDKGGHTVVIELDEYRSKLRSLLNDPNYILVEEDILAELVKAETKWISILNRKHETRNITAGFGPFEPNILSLASFYGLPKIHKKDAPLRPITVTINTPGYKLSKVFDIMLKRVFQVKDIHVKDSFGFKRFIDEVKIDEEDVLISFDIVSMYTNIPYTLAKDIIMNASGDFLKHFGIGKRILEGMVDFLLKECMVFTALDQTFRQTNGLPMGSCISPTIARLSMDRIIYTLLKEIPDITFIKVFVDDTITAIKPCNVMKALNVLNNFLPDKIRFTMERENVEGRINFLNMTLERKGGKVITNWYRKSFASGRLVNYFSSHKRTTVINTAAHFIKTVLFLSDPDFFRANEQLVITTLRENSFPETTITALMNECYTYMKPFFKEKTHENKLKNEYRIFPHAMCKSREVKRVILRLKKPNIRIAESTKNTKINHITTHKTRIPIEKRTNLVVIAKCQCGNKYKINRTNLNETGEITARRIATSFEFCHQSVHAYREFVFKKGLAYKSQTKHLEKYFRLKFQGRIDDHFFNIPVPVFSKLVPKK